MTIDFESERNLRERQLHISARLHLITSEDKRDWRIFEANVSSTNFTWRQSKTTEESFHHSRQTFQEVAVPSSAVCLIVRIFVQQKLIKIYLFNMASVNSCKATWGYKFDLANSKGNSKIRLQMQTMCACWWYSRRGFVSHRASLLCNYLPSNQIGLVRCFFSSLFRQFVKLVVLQ